MLLPKTNKDKIYDIKVADSEYRVTRESDPRDTRNTQNKLYDCSALLNGTSKPWQWGEGTQAGTTVSVQDIAPETQESQGSANSQAEDQKGDCSAENSRDPHTVHLHGVLSTSQYMHVGRLPKTQTRGRTT